LYVGTDPSRYGREVVHCPLIEIRPLPICIEIQRDFDAFTHVILTSPNAARILEMPFQDKKILAIGVGTAEIIEQRGLNCFAIASFETQEGMIALLNRLSLKNGYIFYPRSSTARPLLANYLNEAGLRHAISDLYETVFLKPDPLPSLDAFDEIVFTSPSTVQSFLELYGSFPPNKKLTGIGPITEQAISDRHR
jgi:uroporphyrinogen-III synthase